jgi:hypothetical protein
MSLLDTLNINPGDQILAQLLDLLYGAVRGDTATTAPGKPSVGMGTATGISGTYAYKVTFCTYDKRDNSILGETEGGTPSDSIAPSDHKVEITAIPISGSRYINARRIYRTLTGGSTYYLVTTIYDNLTTSYTDNTPDISLGSQLYDYNTTSYREGPRIFINSPFPPATTASCLANTIYGIPFFVSVDTFIQNSARLVPTIKSYTTANAKIAIYNATGCNLYTDLAMYNIPQCSTILTSAIAVGINSFDIVLDSPILKAGNYILAFNFSVNTSLSGGSSIPASLGTAASSLGYFNSYGSWNLPDPIPSFSAATGSYILWAALRDKTQLL